MEMLDFEKEYVLENARVRLSPLTLADSKNLLPFSLNEPELWHYSLQSAAGAENLNRYIENALTDKLAKKAYPFIVFDKLKNSFAGCTRFYDYQATHNTISIGYTWYGTDFQGTGINQNCKHLMLSQAFENWNIERVEFRADFKNKRSIAAMQNIGCTVEGVLRNNCASPNGRRDSIVLSILKNEWVEKVKPHLLKSS